MTPTQERAHRLMRKHPTYGARTRLAMARGYSRDDELADAVADTIDTRRTVDTSDYDGVPAGWQLSAHVDYNAATLDTEGTYSASPIDETSIDRRRFGVRDRDEYRYWTPGPNSFEDYRSDARRLFGMARHAAWLYAWEMIERDEHRDRTAHSLPVMVTASRDGIELGSACLWTTRSEDDDDTDYIVSLVAELIPEAIDEAQAALARLAATA